MRSITSTASIAGLCLFVLVGGWLPGAAHAGTVVTDQVKSETERTQNSIPVTFGQIFKTGDVPKGETLAATVTGQPVPLQVNAKATNPDGSLRHAVLTARIPQLAGDSTEPLAISTASPSTAGSAVSLTQLLATSFDATASLNVGGTAYKADARTLLQAAKSNNSCKTWGKACTVWLSGPLVSEWVVNGPATTSKGTVNPNLQIYFDVRAYAGATAGSIAYVRVNIVVENTWAYTPIAKPHYTATLTSGSANYTSPALTQYNYTRWHKVLWWKNLKPQIYLQQNTQYIQNSLAVPRYEVLQPSSKFLNSVIQSCAPLHVCNQTKAMGEAGAQAAIGPLPRWTSVYIIDPDYRAYKWMLANTDALGSYSIHLRDKATGEPLSIVKHPYVTEANWSFAKHKSEQNNSEGRKYKADLLPSGFGTNPDVWDNAHQPDEGYVPYMVTGSFYYMQELAFGASHNEVWSGASHRGFSEGLIDTTHGQVRGKAWTLREMVNAAYLLPDSFPLKSEFNADVKHIFKHFNTRYTNNPGANPLRVMEDSTVYTKFGIQKVGMAPWMHSFLTWSVGHAAELGFSGAVPFRNWLAKFEIGLMTDWKSKPTKGYCWLLASIYSLQVKNKAGNWLPNYTAVYAANFPTLVGLSCNSPAMVSALGKLRGKHWIAGEMPNYPYSPTGFPANSQIGIATAADSNLPNAHIAWQLFQSRSVQPQPPQYGYNNYPNFALLPRYLPHGPIVSIYASPNPVAEKGDTTQLHWNASGANSCKADWTSSTANHGTKTTAPVAATVSYPISCTGSNGTTKSTVTVTVATAAPPPTSAPPASSAPPPATTSAPPAATGNQPPSNTSSAGKSGGGAINWLSLVIFGMLAGLSCVRRHRVRGQR